MIGHFKRAVEWILCRSVIGVVVSSTLGDWITSPSIPRGFGPVRVLAPQATASYTTRASLFWGFHEAQEIRYVNTYLPSDVPVVELGTSLGVVSTHIARRLNGANKLVCVEANAQILVLARETILVNAPNANIVTVSGAIDYSGRSTTSFAVSNDLISSRLGISSDNATKVPSITLSAVLAESGVADYALVCDVEGAESQILERDANSLDRCKMMIIELHPEPGITVGAMALKIVRLGFRRVDSYGAVYVFERNQ